MCIRDRITTEVAEKIKELNGDKSVSAAFVVGGGGKIHGFTEMLADKLEIPRERVALRGEEVLKEVHFAQEEIKKDPLLVTPKMCIRDRSGTDRKSCSTGSKRNGSSESDDHRYQ